MKPTASRICLYLFGLVWFVAAGMFALFTVINPESLKSALSENNAYQKLVPVVLDEVEKSDSTKEANQIPINDPGVQTAIGRAFPPQDLQNKSETAIDSIFAWLEGKTIAPQFKLDFTSNKQVLVVEIGRYTEARAASLPPCNLQDLQAPLSGDIFNIKCLPPGVTAAQVGLEASQKVASDPNFLKNPVISPDTLKAQNQERGGQQYNDEVLRDFYQRKSALTWGLIVLAILTAILGLLLAANRVHAVKKLAHILLFMAVSLGVLAAILALASNKITSTAAPDKISSEIAFPVIGGLLQNAAMTYLWFAAISLGISLGLYVIHRQTKSAKIT